MVTQNLLYHSKSQFHIFVLATLVNQYDEYLL